MLSTGLPFLCPKAGRRAWAMSKPLCILQLTGSISVDTRDSFWPDPTSRQVTDSAVKVQSLLQKFLWHGIMQPAWSSRWVVDSNSPKFRVVFSFLWPQPGLTSSGAESSKGDYRASLTVLHRVSTFICNCSLRNIPFDQFSTSRDAPVSQEPNHLDLDADQIPEKTYFFQHN